jgi:pimeloyl-ACP methyl ester carboxylesterase
MRKLIFGCALSVAACGSNNNNAPPPPPMLAMACSEKVADLDTLPAGLPAYDSSHRGDVIHCAFDKYISAAEIAKATKALNYAGPAPVSGAWLFHIAYRTERIKPASGGNAPEGDTTGYLWVPDKPRSGGPLVVYAHGTVGLSGNCAPSRVDPLSPALGGSNTTSINESGPEMLALAGYGYTLIAPDYAGFSYGQPPGYSVAEDEAHSVLDATRAAAHLLPTPPPKVVIFGHSQGGHAALSAHSFAKSYGMSGTLVGVAAYAPLWFSAYSWGGELAVVEQSMFDTMKTPTILLYNIYYFYSHGLLYDGNTSMFQAAKADQVKQVALSTQCYNEVPNSLGTYATDYFDGAFAQSVGDCGTGVSQCDDAIAKVWAPRFAADRPPIDPQGAPILTWSGMKDTYFPPQRAQCMFNKFKRDLTAGSTTVVTSCFDTAADHGGILSNDIDYANQWIAARAGIGPEPAACTPFPSGVTCDPPQLDL